MQHTRFTAIALVTAGLALTACGDSDPVAPGEQTAQVRFVNAASGTANVEVLRAGGPAPIVTGLDFRNNSVACINVPATAQQTLSFRTGTNTLASTQFTFQPGRNYTVVLAEQGGTRRATVLEDNPTVPTGQNAIRFINATQTAGDAYLSTPGGELGAVAAANLAPLGTTATLPQYVMRATTQTQARLFNVGATTSPRADLTLTNIPSSRTQTVVFTEAGSPAGATAWTVNPC